MKASDLSDVTVITLVQECNDGRCTYSEDAGWHGGRPGYGFDGSEIGKPHWANSLDLAKKLEVPRKIITAKMKKLIKKGVIDGCACGCRGDFTVSKGN